MRTSLISGNSLSDMMKRPTQCVAPLLRTEKECCELLGVLTERLGSKVDPTATREPDCRSLRRNGRERQP